VKKESIFIEKTYVLRNSDDDRLLQKLSHIKHEH